MTAFFRTIGFAIGLSMLTALPPASAQSVYTAVLVNDTPITNFDINARAALLRLQGAGSGEASRRAEEELVDEALQRSEARRLGISASAAQVERALESIAGRSNLSVGQLGQALAQRGVSISTLRDSIEAQLLWRDVIQARFRATVSVQEQDVLAALGTRDAGDGEATVTEYTLREVIFVVPSGSPDSAFAQREREARALRERFVSCAQSIETARALTGVVVQDEQRRFSSEVNAELNEMLQETANGRLTPPNRIENGVEMIAVCDKREVRSDEGLRSEVEGEILDEEGQLLSRGYIRDLRASATIIRNER